MVPAQPNLPDKQPDQPAAAPSGQAKLVQRTTAVSFKGPIPPPDLLKQYDEVLPGSANLIVDIFRKQTEHRHTMKEAQVAIYTELAREESSRKSIGQWLAFGVTLSALAVTAFAFSKGYQWAGGAIGTITMGGLIWAYVLDRIRVTNGNGGADADSGEENGEK